MFDDLFVLGMPIVEKIVRTLSVYWFLFVGLRLAGKRELGQRNPFDLIVLLLLSNTVQNAIIGRDDSLAGGVLGASVLLLLNAAVARYLYAHPTVARWVAGDAEVLIEQGAVDAERMKRARITRRELETGAREQGIRDLDEVGICRLEVSGKLTFVPPALSDEERRHRELLEQLTFVRDGQSALLARISKLEGNG